MKTTTTYLLICLLLIIGIPAQSQVSNHYNINIYNGLPSNHVYSAITDDYGYLWMCTTNGVVRYDGYELKTFSFADGLSTKDVWGLHLDKKGRIWLRCFSNKLGYIYKNKYHDAYLEMYGQTLFPRHITDYDGGIAFLTRYIDSLHAGNGLFNVLCVEKNDTISCTPYYFANSDVTEKNEIVNFWKDTVSVWEIEHDGRLQIAKNCVYNTDIARHRSTIESIVLHYIFYYSTSGNNIFAFNVHNCEATTLHFYYEPGKMDSLVFADFSKQFIYVMGVHAVYKLDSNLRMLEQFPVNYLVNDDQFSGKSITNFFDDPFWGKCTTTQSNGIHFSFDEEKYFRPLTIPGMANYTYVGNIGDTLALFWNGQRKLLMSINENQKICYKQINELNKVTGIVAYNNKHSLLVTPSNVFLIENKTLAVSTFPDGENMKNYPAESRGFLGKKLMNLKKLVVADNGDIYTCDNGFRKISIGKDSAFFETISEDLYYGITLDPFRRAVWVYNDNQILLYKEDKTRLIINAGLFRKYGVSNIEEIFIDKQYGNIFVQDCNNLFAYDIVKGRLSRLFVNYNLKNAKCYLSNGKIIMAGNFGVLFCKIKGLNIWSAPVVYPNIKNGQYLQAENAIVLPHKIFLKTDKASYMLNMPSDSVFDRNSHSFSPQYKIIVSYGDTIFDLKDQAQLAIDQRDDKISFNTINPQGNGTVKYRYLISGTDHEWHELNANELVLPKLEANNDYTLSIMAGDNVWNSNKTDIILHVIPYWWQTTRWRVVIGIGIVIVLALLLSGIVLLTRYYVEKGNRKKQFLTELELRSIYAQINPHFIFNTLNTALYFIRKKRLDDAYAHVSKFSRLLWAYLESSRNRYITVSDEINNIRNYLELQQIRFDHAFTYEIIMNNMRMPHNVKIPSLLLQPIVENAINHGLVPKETDGHLRIEFNRNAETNDISCIIDDNGVGREKTKTDNNETISKKRSYGGELIKELVSVFNRYEKMGIEIDYIDKEKPLTGTTVIINIKNPQYAN